MAFNTIDYTIMGILPYHFWSIIGATVSMSFYIVLCNYSGLKVRFAMRTVLFSLWGLFVGAVAFGSIYSFIKSLLLTKHFDFSSLTKGGIVFYGGLTGFLLLYSRFWLKKDKDVKTLGFDNIALVIPLFHSFARIGCFGAGCCFGIHSELPISILYTNRIGGLIVSERRIPIQLIESSFELLLFGILLCIYMKKKSKGNLLLLYLAIYSVYRFFVEFLRGDWDRNIYPILSISQIYSIAILLFVVMSYLKIRRYDMKNHE